MIRRLSTRADFSHVVIGGGAVGLAIGARLAQLGSVVVVEQHPMVGMETTSRNSEVIHAGLYYPRDSLKAALCVRGKELLYQLSPDLVPHRQCGKWVVAQTDAEAEYLETLHRNAQALGVPTSYVPQRTLDKYPHIRAACGALELPTTGIVSAHALTLYFQAQLENAGGSVAVNSKVTALEHDGVYRVRMTEQVNQEDFVVTLECVVNAAGLYAPAVANMLFPNRFTSRFAKGNYFAYAPARPLAFDKLIYPCPSKDVASLGTHLTFDMGGQVRFGPDLEWLAETDAARLDYTPSEARRGAAHQAIAQYLPSIEAHELQPLYAGVRPKVEGLLDFYIRQDRPGFVNVLGVESPGLTASPAIAEHVAALLS